MGRPRVALRDAKQKYNYNRQRQLRHNNQWNLTFEDWYQYFLDNGIDKNKPVGGVTKNFLCLCRKDDSKPFQLDNLILKTQGKNNLGVPSRSQGVERPQTWKVKDPDLHKMYMPFLKARAQANFRGEDWTLTFEQFADIWGDRWALRGRASTDLAMTRDDLEGAWAENNVIIVTRREQLRRSREYAIQNKTLTPWGTHTGRRK